VFQPVFELPCAEIVGVEALARWSTPALGDVEPAEFIAVAEDSGTIVPLGAWVLRESCEQLASFAALLERPLELGVNVSAHQLARPGFAQAVRQTLAHAEFPTELLTLDVSEGALLHPDAATMRTLRELGARIVLDDFGTGYSSLAWLKRQPLHGIKIDLSFVAELADGDRDTAIFGAMIELARALDCTITAEGVETDEQLAAASRFGCDRAQGFLLARPAAIEQLRGLFV
jgi:EAL domain-containing protein (putative c-di-GMP-specific phosphodiesterase class I)